MCFSHLASLLLSGACNAAVSFLMERENFVKINPNLGLLCLLF